MKVKFTGVPGEKHESVFMYGQTFPLDEEVEVTNPTAIAKLRNHPHFESTPSKEDKELDEQVRRDFAAAATAGFADAQARNLRDARAGAVSAPAPTAPPVEPNLRPLKSATEFQQVVEGAGVGTDLRQALRPEEQQANTDTGASDGTADNQRAGSTRAAQAARPGPSGTGKR